MDTRNLLISIARCSNLEPASSNPCHSCSEVVGYQSGKSDDQYQVPEPWSGNIKTAPILFISSNPGIKDVEYFPRKSWSDANVAEFFEQRFDREAGFTHQSDRRAMYTMDYLDGKVVQAKRWVSFWGAVRNHSDTLLQRESKPEADYVLTEMVHCKSNNEAGVHRALEECSNKWMPAIVDLSEASIIVIIGTLAQRAASDLWKVDSGVPVLFNVSIGGRNRAVVNLPHPSNFGESRIENCVEETDLERLRIILRQR